MIKNLVFSGGAFKGWAFIGALRALEEYIDYSHIENVAGTSIGSVFGLFYILKISWKYLLEAIMNTNFKNILDIVDINVLFSNHYLIKGLMFKEYIIDILKKHNINPDVTFKELYKLTNIKLTTTALNINKYSIEYFNIDNTPDIKVIDAVIASCSIPLLFPIYVIDGYSYCDGGLCSNFPVDLFEDTYTIGFTLFETQYIDKNKEVNFLDIITALIEISNSKKCLEKKENVCNIIDLNYNNQTYNINQTRDDIFSLYMNGYNNTKNFIFDNFIALKN